MRQANILLLDESRRSAEPLVQFFVSHGYEASLVSSLHEAFHQAKMKRPDVILVADNFHKQEGLKVCEELRGESDTCYANIILLVSDPTPAKQEQARMAGVNDVAAKNSTHEQLLRRVEALVNLA